MYDLPVVIAVWRVYRKASDQIILFVVGKPRPLISCYDEHELGQSMGMCLL